MDANQLGQFDSIGYLPHGLGVIPQPHERCFMVGKHCETSMVFSSWFHTGLCMLVNPLINDFLDTYGFEFAHLHSSVILKLNVFRRLCEMTLGVDLTLRLLMYFYEVELRSKESSDGTIEGIFGLVYLKLKHLFTDVFVIMPRKHKVLQWEEWGASWFYIHFSESCLCFYGSLP